MIIFIDTTNERIGSRIAAEFAEKAPGRAYEYIYAGDMNISHCLGCNFCWLKTPGQCAIKDDYEPVLRKISDADCVWLITDTHFGFVSFKTKNIVDRLMPLVTMNLHFVNKQMRHVARYKKNPDWGIIYTGPADREYLALWCERLAVNFSGHSLGVFTADQYKEAAACM